MENDGDVGWKYRCSLREGNQTVPEGLEAVLGHERERRAGGGQRARVAPHPRRGRAGSRLHGWHPGSSVGCCCRCGGQLSGVVSRPVRLRTMSAKVHLYPTVGRDGIPRGRGSSWGRCAGGRGTPRTRCVTDDGLAAGEWTDCHEHQGAGDPVGLVFLAHHGVAEAVGRAVEPATVVCRSVVGGRGRLHGRGRCHP